MQNNKPDEVNTTAHRKPFILSFSEKITGSINDFTMENRIFNGVCFAVIAFLFLTVIFNFIAGFYSSGIITAAVFLIAASLYYLSRFRKQLQVSVIIFSIIAQLFLITNFFYDAGIAGPTLIGFFLTLLLIISITPQKQHLLWLFIHIVVVISLLALEYLRPDLIAYSYSSKLAQYLDIGYTYLVNLLLICFITSYLKYSFEKNRRFIELQNNKLENLNAEKNKLFSIIAHDLRSPLATIQSYMELMIEFPGDKPDVRQQTELLNLTKGTSDMLANLLIWAKNQMDGSSMKLREVNLYSLVQAVLAVQDAVAHNKAIIIRYKIDPRLMVIADSEMLSLVIRNLINNAIKFTPSGKDIFLESSLKDDMILFCVRDEGVGITSIQEQQLFSFKTTSNYGTNNERGTGLGLVLCKQLIEKMNGKIWYKKGIPKGSVFTIAIPLAKEELVEENPGMTAF